MCEVAQVRAGHAVVELGCGTGHLLAELAGLTGPDGRVLGIEPQPVLAEQARARARAARARARAGSAPPGADSAPPRAGSAPPGAGSALPVTVHIGSAEHIPLPDGSADAVLAQTVLLHLPPLVLNAALTEARRVLKPGGRLVSADQDAESVVIDHPDRAVTRAIVRYAADHLAVDGWLGRRLPRLLRTEGFTEISTEVHPDLDTAGASLAVTIRRAQAAARGGAITSEQADRWIAWLEDQAADGHFLACVSYYLTAAVR
jgi:ubiquinone/menaquinone biosynthesis C-methylase UbiE